MPAVILSKSTWHTTLALATRHQTLFVCFAFFFALLLVWRGSDQFNPEREHCYRSTQPNSSRRRYGSYAPNESLKHLENARGRLWNIRSDLYDLYSRLA